MLQKYENFDKGGSVIMEVVFDANYQMQRYMITVVPLLLEGILFSHIVMLTYEITKIKKKYGVTDEHIIKFAFKEKHNLLQKIKKSAYISYVLAIISFMQIFSVSEYIPRPVYIALNIAFFLYWLFSASYLFSKYEIKTFCKPLDTINLRLYSFIRNCNLRKATTKK